MVVHARPLRALRTSWLARPTTRPFQQRTARGGRAGMAPTPAAHPSPQGRATLAGRLRPLDLDPPATPPSRRPGPAGAPTVTGPLAQRRQRPRRRNTPNTNTTTTTMISTHNHVDMAASLVGARAVQADATAGHPSKQLGHGQTTSRARIDGRATRRRRGDPCTPRRARRSGLAGRVPDRPPTTPRPGGAEPFGPRPASPAATSTTRAEDSGRRQPTRRDHSDPDRRVWRGRAEFATSLRCW
jgi:hypothetical protein